MSHRTNAPTRIAGLLAGSVLVLAACSANASTPVPSSAPSPAPSTPAASASSAAGEASEVHVAQDAKLGAYLTGDGGMTLYVFKKDGAGKSACTGQCATSWPPFTLATGETVKAGAGVTGTFATITRDDGKAQVTYDGAPLYYFAGDKKAGDTAGEGLKGLWFVETPSGTAGVAPSPSAASGGGGGYGGGYGGGAASPAASTAAGASSATIVDYGFQPTSLTVPAGSTVTWTNTGGVPHTVTADDGSFSSGNIAPGSTFRQTFAAVGTFTYHCAIHRSMTATVVVTP